jgi:PAS domain S-box-containing protein
MEAGESIASTSALSPQDEEGRLFVSGIRDHAIFLLDASGKIVSWNAGAAAIYGYSAEEVQRRHVSHFYPEEAQRLGWPQHELRCAELAGRFEDDGWRVRQDGTMFWANTVSTALRDGAGTLRGFARVTRDLTEKQRQEEVLRRSEERFRSLVDGIRDYAIFTLDPDGTVTSWNAGARQIKGYEADEIIGSHFSRFYTPEAVQHGWPQHELEVAKTQGHFEDEGWRMRKDGSRFWASVVITAMRNLSGTLVGYSKITRDLTERHRREEALTQSEERLRKHGQALEDTLQRMREFIATLSHELRNPLAPIRTAASLMAQRTTNDPVIGRLRQTIDRQSGLLARLLDDLSDMNRIEHGRLLIESEQVLLSEVLFGAIEASRPLIEQRGHALETNWAKEPIRLKGDAVRLTQVFINLLTNAARYTPLGGHVRVTADATGDEVKVRVSDTGRGIAPDKLGQIFEPFTQLAPRDPDTQGGLGIGLALARRIVELHGGSIEVQSEGVGRGSEFIVTLPLMSDATRPVTKIRQEKEPEPKRAVRILCVEHDTAMANDLARLLELMGHDVRVAYEGATALREARTLRPELVLLDIDVPDLKSHDLAACLLEQQRDVPPMLVALTDWAWNCDQQRAKKAGFIRYLMKPVTPEAVEDLLAIFAQDPTRSPTST